MDPQKPAGADAQRHRLAIPPGREVLDYARWLGWRRTVLRAAYVLANRILEVSVFDCVRLDPDGVNRVLLRSQGEYRCRFLESDEGDRFGADLDPAASAMVHEALRRGDACHVVLEGERLANIGFYTSRPVRVVDDLVVHFAAPRWYMYGAYTAPAYRGRRLHALGVLGGAQALFERGVPGLVGVYELTNYRSMVSALRMGWVRCGTVYRAGTGRVMRLGGSAGARALGMRLEAPRGEDRGR